MKKIALFMLVFACGGPSKPATTTPTTDTGSEKTPPAAGARGPGYDLAMRATGCWMGGLWSDALGEKDFERAQAIEKRCKEVLEAIGETPASYDAFRTLDAKVVGTLTEKTKSVASKEENASELAATVRLISDAMHETVTARRAADKVKQDAEKDRTQYGVDKVSASPELRKTDGVHALLNASAGPYSADAKTVGMLVVIDRMEIARGLPKHLKIFAVGAPLKDVFGVAPPPVNDDGSMKIEAGTWLNFLTSVASAANRAVPADVKKLEERETLAWNGVLDGLGEKLQTGAAEIPDTMTVGKVARAVTARLHQQLETATSLAKTPHK